MRLVSFLRATLARLIFVLLALVGLVIAGWILAFGLAAPSDRNPIPLVILELVLGAAALGALAWYVYSAMCHAVLAFAPHKLAKPIAATTTFSLLWFFALLATVDSA